MATRTQDFRRQCVSPSCGHSFKRFGRTQSPTPTDPPPLEPPVETEEPCEPAEIDLPCTDDAQWEVFIADDDCDPLPERGDFWNDEC